MERTSLDDYVSWAVIAVAGTALLVLVFFFPPEWTPPPDPYADDPSVTSETLEGRVVKVLEAGRNPSDSDTQYEQQVELEITWGSLAGQRVTIQHGGGMFSNGSIQVEPGMGVLVEHMAGPVGERFFISDFIRRPAIGNLVLLFVVVTVAIGLWTGVRSLVGTAFSVLVIARFILPRILAGQNPVVVCVVGAMLLMAPSLYLVYGWRRKTHTAVLSMGLCLIITWILAAVSVSWTRMTGLGSEESSFLIVALQQEVDLRGLVLGGVILGTLGVLDDVTIGQASAIFELHSANPALRWTALFRHGMIIGRDHIASMVNTLVMAYVGASLPLLLVLMLYQEPLRLLLNRELLAEEIIRTLVGSIGLMLAVPVTSLMASLMARREPAIAKAG